MSAQDALAYGLIDEIVLPDDEKVRGLALPPPGAAPQLFGELPADAENYEFGKIVSGATGGGFGGELSVVMLVALLLIPRVGVRRCFM